MAFQFKPTLCGPDQRERERDKLGLNLTQVADPTDLHEVNVCKVFVKSGPETIVALILLSTPPSAIHCRPDVVAWWAGSDP